MRQIIYAIISLTACAGPAFTTADPDETATDPTDATTEEPQSAADVAKIPEHADAIDAIAVSDAGSYDATSDAADVDVVDSSHVPLRCHIWDDTCRAWRQPDAAWCVAEPHSHCEPLNVTGHNGVWCCYD